MAQSRFSPLPQPAGRGPNDQRDQPIPTNRITAGPFRFSAPFEERAAPDTCRAFMPQRGTAEGTGADPGALCPKYLCTTIYGAATKLDVATATKLDVRCDKIDVAIATK